MQNIILESLKQSVEVKKKTIKRFYDAGGLITLGTDRPFQGLYLGGFSAHREMQVLSESGIPNADVLKIATINGAMALRQSDHLGSISIGKLADFFIIKGNPLEDIRNTKSVHTVIKGGMVYKTEELLALVKDKMGPVSQGEWDNKKW